MTTDTSEKGLETLIMRHVTGTDGLAVVLNLVAERPPPHGGTGYTAGSAQDYSGAKVSEASLNGFSSDDIAPKVAADAAYQNAKENTPHTARMAHDQALAKVMQHLLTDDTQVYKQFVENESFKRFVGDMVYAITNP